jgi:hypothetical protein
MAAAKLFSLCSASAETAQAPKKIIRAPMAASTTTKEMGMGTPFITTGRVPPS